MVLTISLAGVQKDSTIEKEFQDGSITPTTIGYPEEMYSFEQPDHNNYRQALENLSTLTEGEKLKLQGELQVQCSDIATKANHASTSVVDPKAIGAQIQQGIEDIKSSVEKLLEDVIKKFLKIEKTLTSIKDSIAKAKATPPSIRDQCLFKVAYQENLPGPILNGPQVYRFGIRAGVLKDIIGTVLEADKLHPLEQILLEKAFNHLSAKTSANNRVQINYCNNVSLVDIFARDDTGLIKPDTYHPTLPEIHTVALWRRTDNEFVLIDPTKASFSEIILKYPSQGSQIKIVQTSYVKTSLPGKQPNNDPIFYGTGGVPPGRDLQNPKDCTPRDCTDIAVKIAFLINELQKKYTIAETTRILPEVKECLSNKETLVITQLKGVLQKDAVKAENIRNLQSSNSMCRAESLKLIEEFIALPKGPKNKPHHNQNWTKLEELLADIKADPTKGSICCAELKKP